MGQNISMQQLKQQILTPPEKFVLETIKGVKPSEPDKNGDISWYKDDKWLFTQSFKGGHLFVSNNICSFLVDVYKLNYDERQQLIKSVMYKYTNNGKLIPVGSSLAHQKNN